MTTSLETSKKLYEAGVNGNTEKFWCNGVYIEDFGWMLAGCKLKAGKEKNKLGFAPLKMAPPKKEIWGLCMGNPKEWGRYGEPEDPIKWFPSYSSDELLEMLPWELDGHILMTLKGDSYYCAFYYDGIALKYLSEEDREGFKNKTICEALAELLLWLKQNYPESLEVK